MSCDGAIIRLALCCPTNASGHAVPGQRSSQGNLHAPRRYAAAHGHSQEDMTWLFKSRTTPGVYSAASGGAWQQIAKALPDRTTQQVCMCFAEKQNSVNSTTFGDRNV